MTVLNNFPYSLFLSSFLQQKGQTNSGFFVLSTPDFWGKWDFVGFSIETLKSLTITIDQEEPRYTPTRIKLDCSINHKQDTHLMHTIINIQRDHKQKTKKQKKKKI